MAKGSVMTTIWAENSSISMRRALPCCGEQRRQSRYLLAFVCFLLALRAFGQMYNGAFTGDVKDPTGALIPAAKVTIVDSVRGYTSTATADQSGYYALRNVRPGVYRLTIEATGFKTYVRDGLTLEVDATLTLDATLEVGTRTETVSVAAESPLIATKEASTGQVVNEVFVDQLPLVGRAVFNLAMLAPGVTEAAGGLAMGTVASGNNFISNGLRNSQFDITIDGITTTTPNQNTGVTEVGYTPVPDAVEEFKVRQNTYDASVGFGNATVVNTISEGARLEFRAESFNALNHPVFNPPSVVANTATFGEITSERSIPRQVQLVVKAYF